MLTKKIYRWIALSTVFLMLLTVFSVVPMGITSAQENPGQGDLDQQDGLSAFQRTHGQLVQESRSSISTGENVEYTPRYDIRDLWAESCADNTIARTPIMDGFCEELNNPISAPGSTEAGSGQLIQDPAPNMMTTANAWESYDLNYYTATYGGGYTPPDTMGAVGPTQFVVTQNGAYRFHNKLTGAPDVTLDVSAEGFWPVSVDPFNDGGGDPRVRYDRLTDQWIVIAFTRTNPNRIIIARSDGPIISGATIWTYWYIDPGSTINGALDANCFADYPMLGVDNNAIMIGANIFNDTSCANPLTVGANTTLWVMPKATLPGGGGNASATTHAFTDQLGSCTVALCAWAPMPADNYEGLANSYVIAKHFGFWNRVQVGTITWAGAVPSLSWTNVTTNTTNEGPATGVRYQGVPSPVGAGTSWGLDNLAFRPIGGAHVRNGTILTSMSNTVDGPTGTLVSGPGNGDRHSATVLEINVNTFTVVQDFNIYDTATGLGSQPIQYWMPAAIYNGQGHLVVGMSAGDSNAFPPSAAYATQLNSDPANSFNTPVIYLNGTNTGNIRQSFETSARPTRWGDYSMTTVDPCDDMTVYTIQEYQDTPVGAFGGNWAVGVAQVSAPAPVVTSGSPDPVPLGSASESVAVIGTDLYDTSSNASVFCRTRLDASTIYPGLGINSVTYNSPTSMDIDFDTTSAACGTALVTITNPDGQTDNLSIDIGTVAQCTRSITIDDPVVTEGSGGSFTVSISPTSTASTDVTFDVTDGSATGSGTDYTMITVGMVTIPANTASATIDFTTNDDSVFEGSEDFVVDLTAALNFVDTVTITDSQGTATINDNESEPVASIGLATVTQNEGNAGTTFYTYVVSLSNTSTSTVTVDYTTNDGTATIADSDYVDNDGTLTFTPGQSLKQIDVLVNGDTKFETNEEFTVTLNNSTNSTIDGANDTSTGEITNDDTQPEISISPATVTHNEGNASTTDYVFTVTLSNASYQSVTVDYDTDDGTATTADSDYVNNDNTLTFNPGASLTQNVTVLVNGDTQFESNEDFTVTLSNAGNATIDGANDTSTGEITNDDGQPVISISPTSVIHDEGNAGATDYVYTVTLSNASTQVVTVDYDTDDGTATLADGDYVDNDSTLTFNPGASLTQNVTVLVNGDTQFENSEGFTVTLSNANNATVDGSNDSSAGTITNDDAQPEVSISPATVTHNEGNAGTTPYEFTVTLSASSIQVVTVDYSVFDDSATVADNDYIDNDNTLTFNPGTSLTQTVTVLVNGDTQFEPNEAFGIFLSTSTNSTIDGANNVSSGEITNDDTQPQASISPATVTHDEGDAGTTAYEFTVTLSNPTTQSVSVNYETNDGTATLADSDYVDNDGDLTFNSGSPLTQTITVLVNGDTTPEPNEDFTVTLTGSTNSTIDGANDTATGNITNDDGQPVISISPATVTHDEGDASTTDYVFTVTLSGASASTVTVDYATVDGTATLADNDYVDNDNTLTFLSGGSLSQNVTVLVNGDTTIEPNEDFTVTLSNASNATIDGSNNTSTGTITNDDAAPVTVDISPATVTHDEGNAGTTAYEFTVSLSGASGVAVTVDYDTDDGTATIADSDYVDNDGALTFLSGDPLSQTITVLVNGNLIYEDDEDFTVTLTNPINATLGADTSTGEITNDDVRPDNDLFVNATGLGALPATTGQTVLNATVTGTDPSLWCVVNAVDSVWFSFTASADQLVTVDTNGSNFDTVLSIVTGTEGDFAIVGCDNDGGTGTASSVDFSTKTGQTYFIMAANNSATTVAPGSDSLTINVSGVARNDALVLFDPSNSNTGILDSVQNSPNEFSYTNTPPASANAEWVMGDWNGDGVRTPGIFSNGAFRYTNDLGPAVTWSSGFWLGNAPGRVALVAGRYDTGFANDVGNDCIGWVDSNLNGAGDLRFSLKYWCDMTTTPQSIGGILTPQWLAAVLSDSQGFTGTHQWVYGDWDNDGLDEPGVRRGSRITRSTNAPSEGAAIYGAGMGQRWDTSDGDGPGAHGLDDGVFVAGDWNGDGTDTWGSVYDNGDFYYRDVFGWNPGPFEFALQTFTTSVGTPWQVDYHWAATGSSSAPGPAGATILRAGSDANVAGGSGSVDTSRNVEADLSVGKSGNYTLDEVGLVGDSIVWTITVSNTGTAPANGVQITDNVPTELRVDDALADIGTITVRGQTVIFTVESIGVGETVQFQVVTTILNQPNSGTFANSVNVVLPNGDGDGSDANLVASSTVDSVDRLPATGYPTKLRW